ncbi:hypothetical protein J5N97_029720 [Dioscorea zingiberensis]|uniref:Uncharacterized protein n=1 Tax=Dioscorea zingiberensis TaxID=325984 RepID=A0A9D5H3H0_9LILI|nr:hypothetical protein J5N97_029720 [Dioscorea zingiberensis]
MSYRKGSTVWVQDKDTACVKAEPRGAPAHFEPHWKAPELAPPRLNPCPTFCPFPSLHRGEEARGEKARDEKEAQSQESHCEARLRGGI